VAVKVQGERGGQGARRLAMRGGSAVPRRRVAGR
jgi:hypothetical protein